MTDPLDRELADRVSAATPSTVPPFDEIPRRVRRHRTRSALAVAAAAALVAGVAVAGWSLRSTDPDPLPAPPVSPPLPSEEAVPSTRPEPTYDSSGYPSGLVVRLPEGDVDLPADTSCWTGPDSCRRGLLLSPDEPVPDVGPRDAIDFWFARPGWEFSAVFRRAGEDCPRATTLEAAATGDQWFRLTPADEAGTYDVEIYGNGPEGAVSARFFWTTTSDGPVDPPEGGVDLYPESRGEGSYALEVAIEDLGFQPTRSELSQSVDVTIAADGQQRILTAPLIAPSLECGQRGNRGSFYYQMEWDDDISVLGRQPFDLKVVLTIRDTRHVGRATWRARNGAYSPIDFTPPLPGAAG